MSEHRQWAFEPYATERYFPLYPSRRMTPLELYQECFERRVRDENEKAKERKIRRRAGDQRTP